MALGLSTTAPIEDAPGLALAVEIDPVRTRACGYVTVEIRWGRGAGHRIGIYVRAGRLDELG